MLRRAHSTSDLRPRKLLNLEVLTSPQFKQYKASNSHPLLIHCCHVMINSTVVVKCFINLSATIHSLGIGIYRCL